MEFKISVDGIFVIVLTRYVYYKEKDLIIYNLPSLPAAFNTTNFGLF